MKKAVLASALALLAACSNPPPANSTPDETNGAFGNAPRSNRPAANSSNEPRGTSIVVDTNDVGEFRGTRMAQLLQSLDGEDETQWQFVRRHVHPQPTPPVVLDKQGKVVKRNYPWPPDDPKKLSAPQKAWRSYKLWPDFIAAMLHADNWASAGVRARLAAYGRMYELTWKFQTAREYQSPTAESEHWRAYAESMLAYGADGEAMLVRNMILALTNPSEDSVRNAQSVLVQVGEPAVETLCAALWIGFRQAAMLDDGSLTVQGNANFNKYVVDTLYRIGPRAGSQAVFELENSLDERGRAPGTAWRFRKHFVELLGRLALPDSLRTLEAEIERIDITEYDSEALRQGRQVVDKAGTDHATFVYREYLLKAFSGFRTPEALRGVIRIWTLDEDHNEGAIAAILKISGKSVRSLKEARALASALKVDLKGG